jgi:hypothetical protein
MRQYVNLCGGGPGAQGRNRTTDTMIFSHVLYQLSYLGTGPGKRAQVGAGFIGRRATRVQKQEKRK